MLKSLERTFHAFLTRKLWWLAQWSGEALIRLDRAFQRDHRECRLSRSIWWEKPRSFVRMLSVNVFWSLHNSVSASDLTRTNLEILESEPRIRTMFLEISITNVLRSKGLISAADGFLWCFLSPWCFWKWFGVQFGRVLSRKPWIRRKSLGSAPKPTTKPQYSVYYCINYYRLPVPVVMWFQYITNHFRGLY